MTFVGFRHTPQTLQRTWRTLSVGCKAACSKLYCCNNSRYCLLQAVTSAGARHPCRIRNFDTR